MLVALASLGFTAHEARQLMRASTTLHTWAEHECNGVIQRDEDSNRPFWHSPNTGKRIGATSDREAGALKRAKAIAATRGFEVYHQGDPRGCCLYLYRLEDLHRNELIRDIHTCYNSIGIAVYS